MPDTPNTTPMPVQDFIDLAGKRAGVPKWFHDAIFGIESAGGRPDIHDSNKGAIGPGQLMPGTAKLLGVDPRDPVQNILGSLKLQKQLIDKYYKTTGDQTKSFLLAAAAYNAGEGAVEKHGGIPPYAETQNYVEHMARAIKQARQQGTFNDQQGQVIPAQKPVKKQRPVVSTPVPAPGDLRTGLGLPSSVTASIGQSVLNRSQGNTQIEVPNLQDIVTQARTPTKVLQTPVPGMSLKDAQKRIDQGLPAYPVPTGPESLDASDKVPSTLSSSISDYLSNQSLKRSVTAGIKTGSDFLARFHPAGMALGADRTSTFLEGITQAVGGSLNEAGALLSINDKMGAGRLLGLDKSPPPPGPGLLQEFGKTLSQGAEAAAAKHPPKTTVEAFEQAGLHAYGAMLIELPKLVLGGELLGDANLPVQGALGAYAQGGDGGDIVRGAAMGAVYHYGGGITGKYIGRVGNALAWISGPAVEDHILNGTPLPQAIGQAVPMGLFAGVAGSDRAQIADRNGSLRDATLADLPLITAGKLKLAEPRQVVMSGVLVGARERTKRLISEEGGFLGLNDKEPEPGSPEHEQQILERLATIETHPARVKGLLTIPSGQAKDFFNKLYDFTDKYGEEQNRATVNEAQMAYEQGDVAKATKLAEQALHNDHNYVGSGVYGARSGAARNYKQEDWQRILATKEQRLRSNEGGFAQVGTGTQQQGQLTRLPKPIINDLVTLGAFHFEAGTRSIEDWSGRMLHELGEKPDTVKPEVMKQLGEIYARSQGVYEAGSAPVFISGLKQTIKELAAQNLISEKVDPVRLLTLLKQRGQADELRDSGLDRELESHKEGISVKQTLDWLDSKGATIGLVSGSRFGTNVLPGANVRAPFTTEGSHSYHEGIVYSNKALDLYLGLADMHHMGFRPDQISWYRASALGGEANQDVFYTMSKDSEGYWNVLDEGGQVIKGPFDDYDTVRQHYKLLQEFGTQEIQKLEEVQSKRNQLARKLGVTEDPDNAHAIILDLKQEADQVDEEAREIERELSLDAWQPVDEYSRYAPSDDIQYEDENLRKADIPDYESSIQKEQAKKLDLLRAKLEGLDAEILKLEEVTDRSPIPWAPHRTTWYEPALKGFLRNVAENAEPDREGNITIAWTSATEQAERGSLFRVLSNLRVTKNENGTYNYEAIDQGNRTIAKYNIPPIQLEQHIGVKLAQTVIDGKGRKDKDAQVFNKTDEPIGGDWAVPLYGDTLENIQLRWPDKTNLTRFAWRPSGNESLVGQFLEKYSKAFGGSIRLQDGQIQLIMPEQMRLALVKQGQLSYGKQLPALAKSADGQLYGIRNRITTPEQAAAARELVGRKFNTAYNALTGQRVPSPLAKPEGGFLGLSRMPKLDPRVKSDRQDDRPLFTRWLVRNKFVASTSRWLLSYDDPRVNKIEARLFTAQTHEHDYVVEWSRRLKGITELLKGSVGSVTEPLPGGNTVTTLRRGKAPKAEWEKAQSEFVDLLEQDFKVPNPLDSTQTIDNPDRRSDNPLIQRALDEHDSLTKDFKQYLIQSLQARGMTIEDPDNWGITEQGYFRHLFTGTHNIFMDGEFYEGPERGNLIDYADFVVAANKLQNDNPNSVVEIRRRPTTFIDPAERVSSKKYEHLVRELTGSINEGGEQIITAKQIREDLVGTIGKKENISKFLASTLKREGYGGFSKAYDQIMKTHIFQLVRSQELSKLRKDITPYLEELTREHKTGVVGGINALMSDLWGKPTDFEQDFGDAIRSIPGLRNRVSNPDLGLETAVRYITGKINFLKLQLNPKSAFINNIQPLRTLWPFLNTREMYLTFKKLHDPAWKQKMADLGIMRGAVKLETGASEIDRLKWTEAFKPGGGGPFTYISGLNRARGYTAGIIKAEQMGLSGYEAHELGLRWAVQVEFDNSKWDTPRVLRHSAGQFFGQYKGFLIKDLENAVEVFTGASPTKAILGIAPGTPAERVARVGKWAVGTAVVGGARAALSPLTWLGTSLGISTYLAAAALIQSATGVSAKDARFYASALYLGMPGLLGLDISSSMTPLDEPQGFTTFEKAGRWGAGPAVTGAIDLTGGVYSILHPGVSDERSLTERTVATGAKITPYVRMAQRAFQFEESLRTGRPQYMELDKMPVKLTRTQMFFGAFGVPNAPQTLYYEEKKATGSSPFAGYPSHPLDTTFKGFKPLPTKAKKSSH